MADNYLEKRYEEVFGSGARKVTVKHSTPSLNTLLVKNRSIRRYRQDFVVTEEQLRTIVEVNVKLGSAMNRQALRFRIVADNAEGEVNAASTDKVNAASTDKVNALRNILFREPARSESARAYIIVYSTIPEERYIDIDLGISLQSMALKAAELGLNCLIKGNIDKPGLSSLFGTGDGLEPVAVLCVGKAAESVFLKPVSADSSGEPDLKPYTKEGVHYVPKLQMDTILLSNP